MAIKQNFLSEYQIFSYLLTSYLFLNSLGNIAQFIFVSRGMFYITKGYRVYLLLTSYIYSHINLIIKVPYDGPAVIKVTFLQLSQNYLIISMAKHYRNFISFHISTFKLHYFFHLNIVFSDMFSTGHIQRQNNSSCGKAFNHLGRCICICTLLQILWWFVPTFGVAIAANISQ